MLPCSSANLMWGRLWCLSFFILSFSVLPAFFFLINTWFNRCNGAILEVTTYFCILIIHIFEALKLRHVYEAFELMNVFETLKLISVFEALELINVLDALELKIVFEALELIRLVEAFYWMIQWWDHWKHLFWHCLLSFFNETSNLDLPTQRSRRIWIASI